MKIKQKKFITLTILVFCSAVLGVLNYKFSNAIADEGSGVSTGSSQAIATDASDDSTDPCVKTSLIKLNCDSSDKNGGAIWSLLTLVVNILTAGVGIAAVGGLVYGAALYASAGGSSEQTKKAKQIITDVVIGLVAYALLYAFINYLIPGGVLS